MKRFYLLPLFLLLALLASASPTGAQTLQTREVIDSLDTPWEILWGPDNWIWMTERGGRVSRVNPQTGERITILTVPGVHEQSESGLLGMALHPDFADTAWVYLVYNYLDNGQIRERLVRYTYNGSTLVNPSTLIEGIIGNTTHDGSRLMISSEGLLYMTTGDAQNQAAAQSHTSLNGKILRMRLDGTAPADNPFPNAPSPFNLIWTTGHRNPQGLVQAHNGIIYSSEHGPGANDEINIFTRRGNFGWPTVEGPCNTAAEIQFCADSSVIEPIRSWSPTLATAGLDAYNSSAIPEWTNSLLLVTLKEADLRVLKLSANGLSITTEQIFFNSQYGRLRDLCVSPDGRVFIATSNRDGRGNPVADDDRIIEIRGRDSSETPSIVSITTPPASRRVGERFPVTITTTGSFDSGNRFRIELSDSSGSFQPRIVGNLPFPVIIGGIVDTVGGTTQARVLCDVPPGTRYRIRATSTEPADTSSDNGADIVIVAPALFITPAGPITVCEGDSAVLTAPPGMVRYAWNNGGSGRTLVVRDARNYSVQITDTNGCTTTLPSVALIIVPAPAPGISSDGTILTTEDGYTSYQWLRNGQPIAGATAYTFTAPVNGRYSVIVTNDQGCSGVSPEVEITSLGVEEIFTANGSIAITPHPVGDRAVVEIELARAGRMVIVVRDLRGAVVSRIEEEAGAGTYRREIATEALPAGVYFITATSGEKRWETRMLKE